VQGEGGISAFASAFPGAAVFAQDFVRRLRVWGKSSQVKSIHKQQTTMT